MNTRLQVEHPVTELVHGVDLVELQLAVAEGGGFDGSLRSHLDHRRGHAIEVRLYAEDPAADYQPQSGVLTTFEIPARATGIRVDAGFETGSEVSTHYDAMLAKVIAHAPTREQAARAAGRRAVAGPGSTACVTNRDLLVAILRDPDVPGRRGQHRLPRRLRDVDLVATVDRRRRCRWRRRSRWPSEPASARTVQRGIPVALAQRGLAAAASPSSSGDIAVEWCGGRDGYVVDGLDGGRGEPDRGDARGRRRADDVRRARSPATRSTSTGPRGHVAR